MGNKLLLFLFISLMVMMFLGHSHGKRIDQGGPLRAVRRARMQTQSDDDQEWSTTSTMSFDEESAAFSNAGKMEDDHIQEGLPGQPSRVMFKQYAGYISVDDSKGRNLFYYFTEAVNNPSSKPLILWLNGGPGCSSLGVGAMVEIGPFGVKPDGRTLYSRRFSWNKVANTLYLESPAGVGFSYSNTSGDYALSGDKRTAEDTYTFLINWFRRFPHYKAKDFYIIGESYAGFYVPELADVILKRNMDRKTSTKIQLRGIMIGNGIMHDVTDTKGMFDYVWSHALISDETHQGLLQKCTIPNFNNVGCDDVETRVWIEAGNIDFYNIYSPICLNSSFASGKKKIKRLGGYDPCEEDYVQKYLNLPQVQESLHANRTKLPYAWDICSDIIHQFWKDSPSSMFPIYRRLIASGLRILLYSGDMDAVVPVTSTRYSLDALNLKVIKPWHFWLDDSGDVGGYQIVYEGLTFTTVRGAGHEVPRFQPRRVLTLLKKFIADLF